MATYEDIRKANAAISTTDIKGKDYAEVNQRVKAFRMVYPEGAISNEIVSLEGGVCVMKATCSDETGRVLGIGHAYEKEGSTFINKTSYIENCETSAVGRALGMAGFGIDTSICSAEELQNAVLNQGEKKSKSKTKTAAQTVSDAMPDLEEPIDEEAARKLQPLLSRINKVDKTFWQGIKTQFEVSAVTEIKKKDFNNIARLAQQKIDAIEKEESNE